MLHTVHLDFLFIAIFGTNCVITANLYTDDGFINVLNSKNFAELVTTQPTVVQFYLPQCGACQNYAPIYKTLSKSISNWQWAVKLGVVDCNDKVNEPLLEKYAITAFPTTLGMHPVQMNKYFDADEFRTNLSTTLINFKQHDRLVPGSKIDNSVAIYGPSAVQNAMIILDFHSTSRKSLRSEVYSNQNYSLMDEYGKPLVENVDEAGLRKYLLENLAPTYAENKPLSTPSFEVPKKDLIKTIDFAMPVYAADIVASMDYLLSQDISRIYVIEGADMDALKEFLDSVVLYLDLGQQYNKDLQHLKDQVSGVARLKQDEWRKLLESTQITKDNVQFIACRGSQPHLRGYPCGLWIMFHSMTVKRYLLGNHTEASKSIAHALNRFVPRFFSCHFCAFHFAKMTSNVRLPDEPVYPESRQGEAPPPFPLVAPDPASLPAAPTNAREEVLWLNTAHNIVNKRLSGRPSEDPVAPKAVFPSPVQCQACWSSAARDKWRAGEKFATPTPDATDELFAFLVKHYRPSSWRWDSLNMSFQEISKKHPDATNPNVFTIGDMVLVGVMSVCCTAVLALVLFFIVCRRLRVKRIPHAAFHTNA